MVYSRSSKLIPILRYSSLVLLFLAISAQAEIIIKANYQHIEEKIVTFEIRKSLHLNCNVTTPTANDYKITWSKDGQDVNAVESLIGRYNLHDNNQLFEISRTQESDAGHWKCSLVVDDEEAFADFNVYANLVLKLPENSAVVEGEKLTIHCEAFGTDPSFFWKIGEKIYNESDDRVVLKVDEKGCKNALFIYEIAELTDRADYMCIAYNNASILLNQAPRNATTFLRVKGKLAALWPFIGICAEVFVLCAIILIYEKRRNKQDLDESDTDQSPEQKNDQHVKDSDVRQRK